MSYYWFNRKEVLQKAKERYSKEKAAEYYLQNKEAIKEKSKNWYKNLSKDDKDKIKEYKKKKKNQQLIQYKKEALQNKWILFLLKIRMSEKTLKFDIVRVKKEFHKSKQAINLDLVNVDQIVVSGGFKYFISYKEGEIVKPLCIILPQITGYIKYFENGGTSWAWLHPVKIFSWAVFIHTLWLLLYSNRPARFRKNKNIQSIFNIAFKLD